MPTDFTHRPQWRCKRFLKTFLFISRVLCSRNAPLFLLVLQLLHVLLPPSPRLLVQYLRQLEPGPLLDGLVDCLTAVRGAAADRGFAGDRGLVTGTGTGRRRAGSHLQRVPGGRRRWSATGFGAIRDGGRCRFVGRVRFDHADFRHGLGLIRGLGLAGRQPGNDHFGLFPFAHSHRAARLFASRRPSVMQVMVMVVFLMMKALLVLNPWLLFRLLILRFYVHQFLPHFVQYVVFLKPKTYFRHTSKFSQAITHCYRYLVNEIKSILWFYKINATIKVHSYSNGTFFSVKSFKVKCIYNIVINESITLNRPP